MVVPARQAQAAVDVLIFPPHRTSIWNLFHIALRCIGTVLLSFGRDIVCLNSAILVMNLYHRNRG